MKFNPTNDVIAAYRYLAFLEAERRALIADMFPDAKPGDYMIPFDTQVDAVERSAPPLARVEKVLRAVGIYPDKEDGWTRLIGSWPEVS